ncbi:MAG: hypothetical protein K0S48_863 [Ramlibacter sp.]|jgi:hypothetical protein|nr:hypothetical protein [Ramlibacter sp.]
MAAFTAGPLFISIVSRCTFNGRPLALAVNLRDPGGQLWVSPLDPSQPSQLWMPALYIRRYGDGGGGIVGVSFVNMLTGYAMYAPNGNDQPVSQVPVANIDDHSVWSFGGNEGGGYMAIRPVADDGQNLNIPGDGPYKPGPVITYRWAGGPWNSQWTCIPSSAPYLAEFDVVPYAPFFRGLYCRAGWSASVNPSNPTGQLVSRPNDLQQQGQLFFPALAFYGGMPWGIAVASAQTNQALYVTGSNGSPVTQVPLQQLDAHSLWSPGGSERNHFFAFRPVLDPGQNMELPGNGPYGPDVGVVTWGWGGGQNNEVWTWLVPDAAPMLDTPVERSSPFTFLEKTP